MKPFEYDEFRAIAKELGLRPRRRLGQYYVHDPDTVRRIAATCDVGKHDHVLDIGSGMGAPTLALLGLGARVTAVDVDPILARQLPMTIALHSHSEVSRLMVLNADVLTLRQSDIEVAPSVALLSLPRRVATGAALHLLTEFPSIRAIVAVVDSAAKRWQETTRNSRRYDADVARLRYLASIRECDELPASAFWRVPRRAPDLIRLDRIE